MEKVAGGLCRFRIIKPVSQFAVESQHETITTIRIKFHQQFYRRDRLELRELLFFLGVGVEAAGLAIAGAGAPPPNKGAAGAAAPPPPNPNVGAAAVGVVVE